MLFLWSPCDAGQKPLQLDGTGLPKHQINKWASYGIIGCFTQRKEFSENLWNSVSFLLCLCKSNWIQKDAIGQKHPFFIWQPCPYKKGLLLHFFTPSVLLLLYIWTVPLLLLFFFLHFMPGYCDPWFVRCLPFPLILPYIPLWVLSFSAISYVCTYVCALPCKNRRMSLFYPAE